MFSWYFTASRVKNREVLDSDIDKIIFQVLKDDEQRADYDYMLDHPGTIPYTLHAQKLQKKIIVP